MRVVFGIDISKRKSNVAVLVNEIPVGEFIIENTKSGFNHLKSKLNDYTSPEVVFEATGIYSQRLRKFLENEKFLVFELNPYEAKTQTEMLRNNKTDKIDAKKLAKSQFKVDRKPSNAKDSIYSKLYQDSRFYQSLIKDQSAEKNRLERIIQLTFPEIEKWMSPSSGVVYWKTLMTFPIPDMVLKEDTEKLADTINSFSSGVFGTVKSRQKAVSLKKLAKDSFCSADKDSSAIMETQWRAQKLLALHEITKKVKQLMNKRAKKLSDVQVVRSIPGIKDVLGVSLIAEIGDMRRFSKANQIDAFVGIDPVRHESGESRSGDRISKKGNAYARKLLYQAVNSIVSKPNKNHIKDFYEQKKEQFPSNNIPRKKIAVAAMSRLIRTIYHLVINNETYDYEIASRSIK